VEDENLIAEAKQRKIDQIVELELIPMFIRYSYKNKIKTDNEDNNLEISSAH